MKPNVLLINIHKTKDDFEFFIKNSKLGKLNQNLQSYQFNNKKEALKYE